jgi:hypothetical protein
MREPVPTWLPLRLIGPFLAYEMVALIVLRYRASRGKDMPAVARFANAMVETSLPTVILWEAKTNTPVPPWRSALGLRCSISCSSLPRPCGSILCCRPSPVWWQRSVTWA